MEKYGNIVKNKYMVLRRGKFALEHAVQETLNPLISPLNQLVQTKEALHNKVKQDAETSTMDDVVEQPHLLITVYRLLTFQLPNL